MTVNSNFSNPESHALNFSMRAKSIANNVISRLKRRVSLPGNSRLSFNIRSNANLSIYRVSEQSDESPEKKSSELYCKNSAKTVSPMTKARQYQSENGEEDTKRHASRKASSRGRVSQSFYFHANRLSLWKANNSILDKT